MINWSFRSCFPLFVLLLLSNSSEAQIIARKDTIQRDFGISINWRYLPFPPREHKISDIVGGFHFAFETRADKFWIQTGILVNWDSNRGFNKGHLFLFTLSAPYEFEILKRRLILGLGPTFNFYYTHETDYSPEGPFSRKTHGIAFGIDFEITVPIWKGLSFETCSDFSIGPAFFDYDEVEYFFPSARLVSLGINYRIPAYSK